MKRRQILDKLRITEISGVDRPCQEHARMTIMKRDSGPDLTALKARIEKLQASVAAVDEPINKFWSVAARVAAAAARRMGRRTVAAVATRRGRRKVLAGAGRAVLDEVKGSAIHAGRKAVQGAAIAGATTAAQRAHERAMELLEERRKRKKHSPWRPHGG